MALSLWMLDTLLCFEMRNTWNSTRKALALEQSLHRITLLVLGFRLPAINLQLQYDPVATRLDLEMHSPSTDCNGRCFCIGGTTLQLFSKSHTAQHRLITATASLSLLNHSKVRHRVTGSEYSDPTCTLGKCLFSRFYRGKSQTATTPSVQYLSQRSNLYL